MEKRSGAVPGTVSPVNAGDGFFFSRFMAPTLILLGVIYSYGNLTRVLSLKPPLLMPLEKLPSPHYGPFPTKKNPHHQKRYRFESAQSGMGRFPLWRIEEIPPQKFHQMVLKDVPPWLKEGAQKYLSLGLDAAEKYQIDPFWVVAVMWVESHFDPQAKSHLDATGLMQILPGTGHFIHQLMGKSLPPGLSYLFVQDPHHNVEMGVFYLKRLLDRFGHNHTLATVAYNMGPTTVQKRLRYRLPVGVDNLYLNKVRRAYQLLSRSYRIHLVRNPPEHIRTYAAHPGALPPEKKIRDLFEFLPPKNSQPPAYLAMDEHPEPSPSKAIY